ncbi:ChbG/HpnK family deacetylase [Ottowia sp. VDI28]|uniref:ChbG/HpnK family deacetylase n=1 Tax=Ottowia sp. VDI28 TaxID=3133968 RepID=UPI003C2ABFC1
MATTEGGRRVVLCADDYGMSAGVSEAVLRLAGQQRLSATSAMVLSPRWHEDARRLAEWRGVLDVGLHLDWTSDFAQAAGHGLRLGAAMRRAMFGGFDQAAARVEIERQLDAFEAAWQAPPDHIDGHQHIQQFAGIRQALIQVATRRYGARLPWMRVSRPAARRLDVKGKIIAAMGADALTSLAAREGVPTSAVLSGIYGFEAEEDVYARHVARWLAEAPDGAVLMCHPSAQPDAGDEISPARVREMAFLQGPAFADLLRSEAVRLVRGSELYQR